MRAEAGGSALRNLRLRRCIFSPQHRSNDYVFSYDRMLASDGDTAVYLEYALVRVSSILRKAREAGADVDAILADRTAPIVFTHGSEARVPYLRRPTLWFPASLSVASLHRFCLHGSSLVSVRSSPTSCQGSCRTSSQRCVTGSCSVVVSEKRAEPAQYDACVLRRPQFLFAVAGRMTSFHRDCNVLGAETPLAVRDSRLRLCAATSAVMRTAMLLLGIEPLERF